MKHLVSVCLVFFVLGCLPTKSDNSNNSGGEGGGPGNYLFEDAITVNATYQLVDMREICNKRDNLLNCMGYQTQYSCCEDTGVAVISKTFDLTNARSVKLSYTSTRTIASSYSGDPKCYVRVCSQFHANWIIVQTYDQSVTNVLEGPIDLSSFCGEKDVRIQFLVPANCGQSSTSGVSGSGYNLTRWSVSNIKVSIE